MDLKLATHNIKLMGQSYSIQSNSITRKNRPLKLLKDNRGSLNVSTCSNPLSVKFWELSLDCSSCFAVMMKLSS